MGRETMIKADMEAVGTYNPIFDTTIKQLAKLERELPKAERAWRAAGGNMVIEQVNKAGAAYSAKDPHYAIVDQLRKDILALKNQLGLTPKSLKRVQEQMAAKPEARQSRLEQLLEEAHSYAVDHAAKFQSTVDSYVEGVLAGEIPDGKTQVAVLKVYHILKKEGKLK